MIRTVAPVMLSLGAWGMAWAWAQTPGDASHFTAPVALIMQQQPESVYAPIEPLPFDAGVNEGGLKLDLTVRYLTDYVFRGLERFEVDGSEDQANLQFDGKLSFDLGRLPHPFVAVFVNVASSDDVSSFQEIRPVLGFDWTLRPITFSAGHTGYIYPDRDPLETSEVWARIALDDSYFFRRDKPLFSPYIYGAYDYDLYNGWYLEAGVSHTIDIEDTGLSLTFSGSVAYVRGVALFAINPDNDSGFQHYQIGLTVRYSLNTLLNIPRRYGEWSAVGYLNYTDGIENRLRADTQLWGGAGINLRY